MTTPKFVPDKPSSKFVPDQAPAPAPAAPDPGTAMDTAKDAAVGVGEGATMGWDDEMYGALSHVGHMLGVPGAQPYTKARDEWRTRQDLAHTRSPVAAGAGQLAGAIGTGLATGGLGAEAGLAGQAAVLGGTGAVQGLGGSRAKTGSGMAADTALGAGAGMIMGGAMNKAGGGLSRMAGRLAGAADRTRVASVGLRNPDRFGGAGQVSQALREEGVTKGLAPGTDTLKTRIRERIQPAQARLKTQNDLISGQAQQANAQRQALLDRARAEENVPMEQTPPSAARVTPPNTMESANTVLAPPQTHTGEHDFNPADPMTGGGEKPPPSLTPSPAEAPTGPASRNAMRPPPPSQPGMPQVIPSPEPMELRQGMMSAGKKTLDQRGGPAEHMPDAQYPIKVQPLTTPPGRLRARGSVNGVQVPGKPDVPGVSYGGEPVSKPGSVSLAFDQAAQGQVAPADRVTGHSLQYTASAFPSLRSHPEALAPEKQALLKHYQTFPRQPGPTAGGSPDVTRPATPDMLRAQAAQVPGPNPQDVQNQALAQRRSDLMGTLGGQPDPLTGQITGGSVERMQQGQANNPLHGGGHVAGLTIAAARMLNAVSGGHGMSGLAKGQEAASSTARVLGAVVPRLAPAGSQEAAIQAVDAADHYRESMTNPYYRKEHIED